MAPFVQPSPYAQLDLATVTNATSAAPNAAAFSSCWSSLMRDRVGWGGGGGLGVEVQGGGVGGGGGGGGGLGVEGQRGGLQLNLTEGRGSWGRSMRDL